MGASPIILPGTPFDPRIAGAPAVSLCADFGVSFPASQMDWINQATGLPFESAIVDATKPSLVSTFQGRNAVSFDGVKNAMFSGVSFTLNSPYTFWLVARNRVWINQALWLCGADAGTICELYNNGVSPNVQMYQAGALVGPNVSVALNVPAIIQLTYNGASSNMMLYQSGTLSNHAATLTAGNLTSGFTLGAFKHGGNIDGASAIDIAYCLAWQGTQNAIQTRTILEGLREYYHL